MDTLVAKIEELKKSENKLLLVIGQPGSGKSRLIHDYSVATGVPIIDFNKIFGEKANDNIDLLSTMKAFLTTYQQKVLLLDNKRILYSKDSKIDLLAFLKEISKDVVVVATWNGMIEDGQLTHIRSKGPNDLIYSVDSNDFNYILC
ncbi:MAG: BREX-3 system P-loop-containing protein BrxF [Bacilli bacterium]|nr:BREX-3 system P-loop-containing protein BrxF [Bacilli bacterium]